MMMEMYHIEMLCFLYVVFSLKCYNIFALSATKLVQPIYQSAVEQTAKNLFAICSHLQDPNLYDTQWADACRMEHGNLVATRNLEKGDIISLYPVHLLGIAGSAFYQHNQSRSITKSSEDFFVFDTSRHGWDFFQESCFRQNVDLLDSYRFPYPLFVGRRKALFIDVDPEKPDIPGWQAHRALTSSKVLSEETANCVIAPLAGAAPLYAVVATEAISIGERIMTVACESEDRIPSCADLLEQRYTTQISELRSYLNMAYVSSNVPDIPLQYPFYGINLEYPGLEQMHKDPDVWIVNDFLSATECEGLIAKVRPNLIPCLIKNADTGEVGPDPSRTSTNANVPKAEIPSIIAKLKRLVNCQDENRLEMIQALHYSRGQLFRPHTDGYSGPVTACGFRDSGRLVTVFVYLNDVVYGGQTRFQQLDLEIAPQKGMAVLHFPNTIGLEEDIRTEHESVEALDEKWLLVTWLWKDPLSDPSFNDDKIPFLTDEII